MRQTLQCTGDDTATPWKSLVCYQLLAEGDRDQKEKKNEAKEQEG